jgi:hypothetical protein
MPSADPVLRKTLLAIPGCRPEWLRGIQASGLIETPKPQPHLRGKPYHYASGTEELVRGLVEIGQSETRFDNLGFVAWWAGHAVPMGTVRRILKAWLDAIAAELRDLRVEHGDALGVGEAMAKRAVRPQSADRLARRPDIRRIKRNTADVEDFGGKAIPALASLAYGEEPTWELSNAGTALNERSTETVLQAAMGVDRAASQPTPDGRTVLPEVPALAEIFDGIRRAGVTGEGLTATLDALGDDQLLAARDAARTLLDDGGATVRRVEADHGHGSFGLGLLAAPSEEPRNLRTKAFLVVGLAAAMERAWSSEQRENLPGLLAVFSEAAKRPSSTSASDSGAAVDEGIP